MSSSQKHPGLLFVASKTLSPALTPLAFNAWYEDTHIPQVLSLPGLTTAVRYEKLPAPLMPLFEGKEFPGLLPYEWLTLYEMPDPAYRESRGFKGLDGQSKPEERLEREIFRRAEFETRFYEGFADEPPTHLITAVIQPTPATESDFNKWYDEEHIPMISKVPGHVKSLRYKLLDASTLTKFERTDSRPPRYLALHHFRPEASSTGEGLPMEALVECDRTPWSLRVLENVEGMEVGFWRVKRRFDGTEGVVEWRGVDAVGSRL
ncbi:hypothetical protein M501DRAFT_943952 [Patellaria atrata CBS 101060]|uniref:EthD domain-containing protein n=1 Tax=Patellaria atrata CBS 101060 TaxID=1346257 RepID=A0A9P4S2R4_9PEZI|nr:hypothetical protein M501DRAFT_943952 [Patellaria atrata CBS 101060]